MPRNNRRRAQIKGLVVARRTTSAEAVRRVTLCELVGHLTPWCSPAEPPEINRGTSSESGGSEFDGPDISTVEFVFAKKTNFVGEEFYPAPYVATCVRLAPEFNSKLRT
jgi:hypothetical protein